MPDSNITLLPNQATPSASAKIPLDDAGVTSHSTKEQLFADEVALRVAADAALEASISSLTTDKAPKASPIFTGSPTAPTAAPGTNTTQVSTTAFVQTAVGSKLGTAGGTMSGNIDMDTNKIVNLDTPVDDLDATTKLYTDDQDKTRATTLENYDPTGTSAFPTTWNGNAIILGNRFYITAAGTMAAGASVVQIGDVIEARQALAGNNAAHWSVVQANSVQATTSVSGIMKTATDAEALAKSATTAGLTPSNLAAIGATADFVGLVELATQEEVNAGSDTERAVTPATLEAKAASDWIEFVGLPSIINISAGTWTNVRISQGNYVKRHTVADNTAIIGIDLTPQFREAASRGFKLNNISVIYKNDADNLDAHTYTLTRLTYSDSDPVTAVSIVMAGALGVGQDADPRVTVLEVSTPAYLTTGHKYVFELTVNNSAASEYDFYGILLNFSKTN
jgi:hypothetical protein